MQIKSDELYVVEGRILIEYQRVADILSQNDKPLTGDMIRDIHQRMRYILDLRYDPPVECYKGGNL